MQKFALYIISVLMVFLVSGCNTQTPTQKYRNAVNVYDTTVALATTAIDNDDITLEEAEVIADIESLAYNKLVEMRSNLAIDPQSNVDAGIDVILSLLQAIKDVLKPADPEPTIDPLPMPAGS